MTQVLIIANGAWPESFNLEREIPGYSTLIALDGASNRLLERGIVPDVVVGDMDSIEPETLAHCRNKGAQIIHDTDQERSDISKGLRWIEQHDSTAEVSIVGVEIGRYDHHLAAYSSLFEHKSSATILLNGWVARRVSAHPEQIAVQPGCLVSLIPFGKVKGVCLIGCQYSLEDATLVTGTRGVSNTAIESSITVSAKDGDLLLLVQR